MRWRCQSTSGRAERACRRSRCATADDPGAPWRAACGLSFAGTLGDLLEEAGAQFVGKFLLVEHGRMPLMESSQARFRWNVENSIFPSSRNVSKRAVLSPRPVDSLSTSSDSSAIVVGQLKRTRVLRRFPERPASRAFLFSGLESMPHRSLLKCSDALVDLADRYASILKGSLRRREAVLLRETVRGPSQGVFLHRALRAGRQHRPGELHTGGLRSVVGVAACSAMREDTPTRPWRPTGAR